LPESLRTRLNLTANEGLLVVHVEPGSPADKAAIFLGDVLITLAGKPADDIDAVQNILRSHKPGDSIEASLVRGGAITTLSLRLEPRAA
jgi:S1-C subfamily serine protease